jgi:hypothetical protein
MESSSLKKGMNDRGEVSTPEYDEADRLVQAGGLLHRLGRRGMMPDRAGGK